MLTAITRKVSPAFNQCELTHLTRQPIDIEKAREQHDAYEIALRSLGVKVISLAAEETLPDSVFVEDTAVVLDEVAVITCPGANSRRSETTSIKNALAPFRKIRTIQPPATLDGGDVLVLGRSIYIGRSTRSNPAGIQQMQSLLADWGYRIKEVNIHGCLHLKSAVTQVSDGLLLLNPKWVNKESFSGMDFIAVDEAEPMAANSLLVDNKLIYPDAYPKTLAKLIKAGITTITLDISEIAKAEGGVTCCALLFKTSL